jgi:hypothetical protein
MDAATDATFVDATFVDRGEGFLLDAELSNSQAGGLKAPVLVLPLIGTVAVIRRE